MRDFLSILSHPSINVDVLVMHVPTKEDKFVSTEDRLCSVHYFNSIKTAGLVASMIQNLKETL